ncbi:hypothetical protein [Brevibacillus invocatus]|uniref:hypothetical protein n=1 Tax=Brevibacillus invocatus TaxID=173959 RepID=UPI002041CFDF|nr:hypothetical protein [Brevibacillus invocatus]MCM3079212.1 hypothetical protein [Brevibacillus invocatus]MCM3429245.1 hypothetical protein [Brevibacillus invocatus]
MTNVEIWEWMQRDLDGDLAPEEQAALLALLEKDSDLQLKYNRLKSVSLQLEQLPPVVPSFSIVDSILPKLESAAATPAAKADLNEVVLPTLEVKRTSSQPSESKKWKNKTVWFARIGSTAVAACLLIGVLLVGNEARKQEDDPATHGSTITPTAVEPPAFIGPPAPQPSTNPTPVTEVGEEKPATEKTQPPKQQKVETPSKTVNKTPVTPPRQVQNPPAQSVPVVLPMKPVPREPKPPAFPFGLEEKSDDDNNSKSEKDKDKEMRKESKVEDKESKKEDKGKSEKNKDKDDEDDDDHDDDDDEKKESKRQYGRTIAV